jgi:hypothetical protein
MNRNVKKYAGGMLTDSSGNPVRSSSGEPVRTRFGKDEEDRPKSSGVEDYESLGKRAGATSPFAGPKEYITDSTEEESPKSMREPDSVAGKSAENVAIDDDEIKKPVKKKIKKKIAKYEDTGAKIGSQGDFKMKSSTPEKTSGFGPKNTFLTKERLEKSKGVFSRMKSGGKVSSASSRGDGIAQRGKTKGRMC